jgi:CheY-like chemotaxis protein
MPFKVLIVDDEPDMEVLIRQRFRRKIKDGELEFVFAHDGQEALNKLQEDPELDVVMSDINMPIMDGLTLLSHLTDIDRILKTGDRVCLRRHAEHPHCHESRRLRLPDKAD